MKHKKQKGCFFFFFIMCFSKVLENLGQDFMNQTNLSMRVDLKKFPVALSYPEWQESHFIVVILAL